MTGRPLLVFRITRNLFIVGRNDIFDGERFLLLLLFGLDARLTGDTSLQHGTTNFTVSGLDSGASRGLQEDPRVSLFGNTGLRGSSADLPALWNVCLKVGQLRDVRRHLEPGEAPASGLQQIVLITTEDLVGPGESLSNFWRQKVIAGAGLRCRKAWRTVATGCHR